MLIYANSGKTMDNIDNRIAELMASDKFWQCISEELEKRTGESRLGGKYVTDLAKQMFTALPKDQLQALIANALKRMENQQDTGNQECI